MEINDRGAQVECSVDNRLHDIIPTVRYMEKGRRVGTAETKMELNRARTITNQTHMTTKSASTSKLCSGNGERCTNRR